MRMTTVRNYGKHEDALGIPNLIDVQQAAYERFLQSRRTYDQRDVEIGLELLLREVFPIVSYDGGMTLDYLYYKIDEARYTPEECKELRLTYGMPFRIGVRLQRAEVAAIPEEEIYLGELPILLGGGEFIINGAERVIVNQLHRSPGVDFSIASDEGDRLLHSARIIPERGSWIELEVTKKDVLTMRIDQSTKIPATTFLRAISEEYSTTEALLNLFYDVQTIKVVDLKPQHYAAASIVDAETGEELIRAGAMIGENCDRVIASNLKKIDVIADVDDVLILNTIAEERTASERLVDEMQVTEHEAALLYLYARLRPGNPPQIDKARQLFEEKFFDVNRYRLGKVGRFRINRKFDMDVPESEMKLRADDFLNVVQYMLDLRSNRNKAHVDDIDHLGNRRLRTLDELAVEELRKGFLKLRRTVQERMSVKDPDEIARIADLINTKSISSAIEHFFGRSELSQVVDQTNPLSQLTHERRLSALGPGGLNRKRAGFEVRDVHISHYGRICPIETPEGTNIGLIASLGIFSQVDDYGFLRTPYREVKNDVVGKVVYLRADEEMRATLAPTAVVDDNGRIRKGAVLARVDGDLAQVPASEVDYVDVSPKQIVGVSAALIPFLEHDDANRALMGSNMQRQAVPLIRTEPPCVGTGIESEVPKYSGMVVRALNAGIVTYVDAHRIVIDNADEYELRKFVGLNEKTCLNQKPIVSLGERVKAGQIMADGAATQQGELALGKNVLVGFNTFDGYNFEDAIVISERLVKDDVFTSIHIEEFDVEIRETKLGREEFTCDIPNVSEKMLANLNEAGIIRLGAYVRSSDILVGKVSPKSKSELSPEEKLLHAIFGRAGEDVKNESLEVPAGTEGVVIGAKRFSRRMHMNDEQKRALRREMREYEAQMDARAAELFRQMIEEITAVTGTEMIDPSTRQKVGASDIPEVLLEQIDAFSPDWIKGGKEVRAEAAQVYEQFWPRIEAIEIEKQRRLAHMKRGDELPAGVLEMVKIYLATRRQLSVGDKMAGRHGNKGVIARIVPEEDMPFLEDGTPVDVLLNPLGVPSRMNVGQILETHLGWACGVLGFKAVTPVFDGATEDEIHAVIEEANRHVDHRLTETQGAHEPDELLVRMPRGGKVQLYDGRTGESFDQLTTVGYMYLLKLHHLVDDKIHARATGPYSLITQQPLGGKARTGGQRFGEMEVWALEAYGAAYVLQELLTVKSDDVEGRTKIYESMVKGTNTLEAGMPVAFDVLCNEVKGLGLNITLEKTSVESSALL
ncbi:MAG: DNA-directed RNA polymerase subunit beta [Phycisphaeraceae bacterium]|jgi:DNA-directed RNA polymerase subunit beta|nr:DNA-directed RNA polymerase subunit beta [Phycisphaeraceae bacterium]